jgi:putative membrane protein
MNEQSKDPRVYLAAERTFLAWIRTGLALMGFGFVLARFGIFLRGLALTTGSSEAQSRPFSVSAGITLILVGVAVQALSLVHYRRLIQSLNAGRTEFDKPSMLASGIAVFLAAVGFVMAVYLVLVR